MTIGAALKAAELRRMAASLLRIAAEIEVTVPTKEPGARIRPAHDTWKDLNRERLASSALDQYRLRRKRTNHFPAELFAEPAWDILLDLFVAKIRNRNISVTSACIASDVPSTTALRWLNLLEEMNLVRREQHETDSRVTWVRLTDGGFNAFVQYFEDISIKNEAYFDLENYVIDSKKILVNSK